MDALPFYIGGFGLLVLSLIGFAWFQNERLKKKLIQQAYEMLQENVLPNEIHQRLMNPDIESAQVSRILELAQRKQSTHLAIELVLYGKSNDEVKQQLLSRGVKPEYADEIIETARFQQFCHDRPITTSILGMLLPIIGLIVMLGGLALWLGNKSGRFVTFPYAGHFVIAIGVVIVASGWRFLAKFFGLSED